MTAFITDSYKCNLTVHDALVEEMEDFIAMSRNTEPYYLMCGRAESRYLDVEAARSDGYPCVRALHAPAGPYSNIAVASGTHVISARLPGSAEPAGNSAHQMMLAIRDAVQEIGVPAVVDQHSTKTNDLLANGRKFLGYARETHESDFVFGAFLAMDHDYDMFKHMWAPKDLLDEKEYDSVRDRVTSVKDVNPSVTNTELVTEIRESIADRFLLSLESTSPTMPRSRYDELFSARTTDEVVFEK